MNKLIVSNHFPTTELNAVHVVDNSLTTSKISIKHFCDQNKWVVVYFYPKNETVVCATAVKKFIELQNEFVKNNCVLIGVSVDSVSHHENWFNKELKQLGFNHILASDEDHKLANELNILTSKNFTQRATYIISPENECYYFSIIHLHVERNVQEILNILQACQSAHEGKLVPCDWKPGQNFIKK